MLCGHSFGHLNRFKNEGRRGPKIIRDREETDERLSLIPPSPFRHHTSLNNCHKHRSRNRTREGGGGGGEEELGGGCGGARRRRKFRNVSSPSSAAVFSSLLHD